MFEFLKNFTPKFQASPINLVAIIPNPFGGEDLKCQITVNSEKKSDDKKDNGEEAKTEEKKA